ncbi:TRAP transporter substrate-binding protein [Microvirga makkahensis]|uniref:Twin-arginine translocation signal domain-containing protein n=1 Tax=Microvirga makkahensis TaxID=1128670 RepID=A0A7X3MSD3_9HYPH|nr:TRAP transporter substrate-binding protein [Microvirga makkahensis]MXQ12225.1 twin-arginine translocation signal domain-containing protein [Microvirga makkahensis]
MKRRTFLAGTAVAAAAGPIASPAIAQPLPEVRWRLASSYPKSLDTLYGAGVQIAKRVAEATDNRFQIQVFAAGEIVGGLQVLDAVQNNTVECAYTLSSYFIGKDPTFMFEASVPFGLNVRHHNAWMYHGGGLPLVRDFMKVHNVYNIPAGNTGAQMGGWFRQEIKSVEDLKGLKFRIAGMGGQILSRLGVVPQVVAGGDIYPGLERGTLDAVEWAGPYDDEKLGFQKVAKYYYYPGFWEGSAQTSFYANLERWNALPPYYKAALESACAEANVWCVSKYDAENPDALRRLIGAGAELRAFPKDVMDAAYKQAFALYGEIAAANPRFKTIYDAWSAFREKELAWFRLAELPYDYYVYSQRA